MNDIASELFKLLELSGAEYSRQVELIARMRVFKPVKGETAIYSTGGEGDRDYPNQLQAARKAVAFGYSAYILPNPQADRTPDLILERRGIYKAYDLKTIAGKSSAINRLRESIGQCNQIIMNMTSNYSARRLAKELTEYFFKNQNAREVLIFKRGKVMQVTRKSIEGKQFVKSFIIGYNK